MLGPFNLQKDYTSVEFCVTKVLKFPNDYDLHNSKTLTQSNKFQPAVITILIS